MDNIRDEDELPDAQRARMAKAVERLASILEHLAIECPNIDPRSLDALAISTSLMEQQIETGANYPNVPHEHGGIPEEEPNIIVDDEVEKGPCHQIPFQILRENNSADEISNDEVKDAPSADDLSKWFGDPSD